MKDTLQKLLTFTIGTNEEIKRDRLGIMWNAAAFAELLTPAYMLFGGINNDSDMHAVVALSVAGIDGFSRLMNYGYRLGKKGIFHKENLGAPGQGLIGVARTIYQEYSPKRT